MTTLTYLSTVLQLPNDYAWVDEYGWHPVVQTTTQTTTGALLVESAVKQAGQLITLEANEAQAWVARSTCDTLKAWAAIAGATFTLLLRGVSYPVIFDHERTGFEAQPVMFFEDVQSDDFYVTKLRFIVV